MDIGGLDECERALDWPSNGTLTPINDTSEIDQFLFPIPDIILLSS
jgi:hypothetical protein